MQSRRHRTWCYDNPDCDEPKILCQDLEDDYRTAEELLKKYPSRFRYVFRHVNICLTIQHLLLLISVSLSTL